jgi:hypothetical protein
MHMGVVRASSISHRWGTRPISNRCRSSITYRSTDFGAVRATATAPPIRAANRGCGSRGKCKSNAAISYFLAGSAGRQGAGRCRGRQGGARTRCAERRRGERGHSARAGTAGAGAAAPARGRARAAAAADDQLWATEARGAPRVGAQGKPLPRRQVVRYRRPPPSATRRGYAPQGRGPAAQPAIVDSHPADRKALQPRRTHRPAETVEQQF